MNVLWEFQPRATLKMPMTSPKTGILEPSDRCYQHRLSPTRVRSDQMAQKKRTGPPPTLPIDRVLRRVWIDSVTGCWLVGLETLAAGYARVFIEKGRSRGAHVIAYEHFHGPIPDGMQVDHECHNLDLSCPGGASCQHRRCVNPDHLVARTIRENVSRGRGPALRAARCAAQTHCKNGHPFDGRNTYRNPPESIYNNRKCRTCQAEAQRRYRARLRAGLI